MEAQKVSTEMKSLIGWLKQMERTDKAAMIAACSKYSEAKRCCRDTRPAYIVLVMIIHQMENKYGFRAFEGNRSEHEIVDEFAGIVEAAFNSLTGNRTYTCSFNSISEANAWLANQNNLVMKTIQVETTRVGLDVTNIRFEYTVSEKMLGRIYQVAEERKIRFFFGSNQNKFRKKWEEKNPQLTFVHCTKRKWGFSLIGGSVGFFRFIKEKYIVLYAVNR